MTVGKSFQKRTQTILVSNFDMSNYSVIRLLTIEKHIDDFMALYRDSFPSATVTPKLHLLEDHVVPFVRRFNVGFGFLGEQGAESIHAPFNQILLAHSGTKNPVSKLVNILMEHLTQVCPDNVIKQPAPK